MGSDDGRDPAPARSERPTAPAPGTPLRGSDGVHLHTESERTPMHTLKVCVLAPQDGQRPLDAANVAAAVRRVVRAYGFFQIAALPGPLGQPRWFPAPGFDLSHHVRIRTVVGPGGRHELDATISEIAQGRLDPRRPPWQAWVLEGLAGGRVAVVFKLHHALADGGAAAHLLVHLAGAVAPVPDPVVATDPPGAGATAWRAVVERFVALRDLPRLAVDTARAAQAVRALERPDVGVPGPVTRFRRRLGAHRSYATVSLALEDVQAARTTVPGATVNDVVLCLAGGAVRRVLETRGELPAQPVGAGLPVSTDPADAPPRLWGNGWEQLLTTLASDRADPAERLRVIHETTRGAKQVQKLQTGLLARWLEQVPPVLLRTGTALAGRVPNLVLPLPGVTVSNVRGPGERVRMPRWGFELDEFYSVGPVLDGVGLNITAWSYAGRMCVVALTGTDPLVPAVEVTDALEAELAELVARAGSSGARSPEPRPV